MTATITVVCVYNKQHKRTLSAQEAEAGMPLCAIDGGPMIAFKAEIKKPRRR